ERCKCHSEQLHDDRRRDIGHDPQCKNGGPVEGPSKESIQQVEDPSTRPGVKKIRVDAGKDNIRSQPENNQVPNRIEGPDPEVFNRENILYGCKEPLHYFTVVAVPPALSIALAAEAENACASTLSFFLSSPLPRTLTRSCFPTMPFSISVCRLTASPLVFSAKPSSTSRFTALKYTLLMLVKPNFGTRRCSGIWPPSKPTFLEYPDLDLAPL